MLVADEEGREAVVGAIALSNPLTPIPIELLRALAGHLRGGPRPLSTFRGSVPEQVG